MTTLISPPPKLQFFDSNGDPLYNAKLYTYAAGTTTPLATYTDATGNTPNTNPVRTDARGECDVWLGSVAYKFALYTSADVLIWTVDNISGPLTSGIMFTQTGTGAVARTLDDKLQGYIDALDFIPTSLHAGIRDGTNSTNLSTYINSALTAATGQRLVLTPGFYKITSGLNVPAGTWIDGWGATLNCTSSQFKAVSFASGGGIVGVTITGPASGTYNSLGHGVYCSGTNNAPSAPTFVTAPVVENCTISNFGIYGVYFAYVNGGEVRGCTITGIGYAGVGGISCNDTLVTGNRISTIGPGPGTGDAYGVFLDRANGTTEASDPRSYRCRISDNTVKSVIATGVANGQGIDTHAGVDFTISGNTIDSCQVGIAVTASVIAGVTQLGPKRVSVAGNTITGTATGYGILVSGAIVGTTVNGYAEQITVVGNSINGHGTTNDTLTGGIFAQGTKGLVVGQNALRNNRCNGISLGLENRGMNISGNTITDPHDNTLAAPCCVRVVGDNVTGYIGGNTFVYENAALNTYVAIESIRISTTLAGLSIDMAPNAYIGIDATHLLYQKLTTTGITGVVYSVSGSADIALVNGQANNSLAVTFSKRAPATPIIYGLSVTGGIIPGNVPATLTTNTISATDFTVVAYPFNITTWGASGTLTVNWTASV